MNYSYQEVVDQLQHLTHKYSNSSYLTQTQQSTHRRTTFINDLASSSSNSTTSSIPFTIITTPSYHDYTFTNNDYTSHHTINTNINHLPPLVTPNITTRLNTLTTLDFINSNSPNPPTPMDRTTPSNLLPDFHSNTSSDSNSVLCNTEESHRNLPFGDLIASQKDKDNTRVIFQNVNSLDLYFDHHILEQKCDSIGQYEVDISCLAETNTKLKHPYGAASFKAIKKEIDDILIRQLLKQKLIGVTYTSQETLQ